MLSVIVKNVPQDIFVDKLFFKKVLDKGIFMCFTQNHEGEEGLFPIIKLTERKNKMKKLFVALLMAGVLVSVDAFAAKMTACPAGTYSKAGAKSLTDCISCATFGTGANAGRYYSSAPASTKCSLCDGGRIANEEATSCVDKCRENQLLSGSGCEACPTGYKCNGTAQFECLEGYYLGEQVKTVKKNGKTKTSKKQTCLTCPKNAATCTSSTDFTCKEKYFKKGDGCLPCPSESATCTQDSFTCKDGWYENIEKGTCTACPAGYYCSSSEEGPAQ